MQLAGFNNEIPLYRAHKTCCLKKRNSKFSKNKNFTAKTQYLNLITASSNVKMQSDKTLATQTYPSRFKKRRRILNNETNLTKKKFTDKIQKNYQNFLSRKNSEVLKSVLFKKSFFDKFKKIYQKANRTCL